jgi:fatty acid-binding protein DegV
MDNAQTWTEGYDALDVNTSVAIAFVERHKPNIDALRRATVESAPRSPNTERTLIVLDAACDVPRAWLDHHGVAVMPRKLAYLNREHTDLPDQKRSLELIAQLAHGFDSNARSVPLSPVAMRDEMQRHMRPKTEAVLHLCTSARRSKHFVHALSATQSLVVIHNKVRRSLGQAASLTAWVVDSTSVLTGLGVLAAHAVELRERGFPAANIAVTLNSFRNNLHTLIVPDDLAIASNGLRVNEQVSAPAWKVGLGTMLNLKPVVQLSADRLATVDRIRSLPRAFDHVLGKVKTLVENGALLTPFVGVGYAGRLDDIETRAAYLALRAACSRHQVVLSLSTMSLSGIVALGPRALSVSFASQQFSA